MNADGHGVTRCTGCMLVAVLWAVTLSACDTRPSAPETRASYFVEKFIIDPQNQEDLRSVTQLSEQESPEILANDLQTRAAVSYLRARYRLGAEFGFHIDGTNRMKNGNKVVNVVVSEGVAKVGKDAVVRFQVELRNQDRRWVVVHLRSD